MVDWSGAGTVAITGIIQVFGVLTLLNITVNLAGWLMKNGLKKASL